MNLNGRVIQIGRHKWRLENSGVPAVTATVQRGDGMSGYVASIAGRGSFAMSPKQANAFEKLRIHTRNTMARRSRQKAQRMARRAMRKAG